MAKKWILLAKTKSFIFSLGTVIQESTHETQNKIDHPVYRAVQLRPTSHQWGLRFLWAFKSPSDAFRQRTSEIPKPYGTKGIFKSFQGYPVILSLYHHVLFESWFWHAFCNPWQKMVPQWLAQHHRVLAIKVILTTVFDRWIPWNRLLDRFFELWLFAGWF